MVILILNFSHPLTDEQRDQIKALAGNAVEEIRTIPVQIDQAQGMEAQIRALVDSVQFSSQEWQARPLLINPPGYAPAAFVLLAELHGRILPGYEVVELLNLQAIREVARTHR